MCELKTKRGLIWLHLPLRYVEMTKISLTRTKNIFLSQQVATDGRMMIFSFSPAEPCSFPECHTRESRGGWESLDLEGIQILLLLNHPIYSPVISWKSYSPVRAIMVGFQPSLSYSLHRVGWLALSFRKQINISYINQLTGEVERVDQFFLAFYFYHSLCFSTENLR